MIFPIMLILINSCVLFFSAPGETTDSGTTPWPVLPYVTFIAPSASSVVPSSFIVSGTAKSYEGELMGVYIQLEGSDYVLIPGTSNVSTVYPVSWEYPVSDIKGDTFTIKAYSMDGLGDQSPIITRTVLPADYETEQNDVIADADELTVNKPIFSVMETNGVDWFSIEQLVAGRHYTIYTDQSPEGDGVDTKIYLYLYPNVAHDEYVAWDDDSGNGTFSRIGFTPYKTGKYYVKVVSFGSGTLTGHYAIGYRQD